MFECTECGTGVRTPPTATMSCRRCGTVYWTDSGNKFYGCMSTHPIDYRAPDGFGHVGCWMLPWTRPLRSGRYECRFRHTEPHVLTLLWDGATFTTLDGKRVQMTQFLTWRGMLA